MNVLKSFFSHLLAIIFFFSILFLGLTWAAKDLITRNNIYNALEKTEYLDEIDLNIGNENSDFDNLSKEVMDYIEFKDIIDHFIADRVLYGLGVIETNPKVDIVELNERIADGIERYLDDKLNEYSGGLNSFLESNGIDLGIKDKIEEYINNNTDIDLSANAIITEKDLEPLYKEVDELFLKLEESSYITEIIDFIYNDKLPTIYIIVSIVAIVLIGLINFNIMSSFAYSIAPFVINALMYLIGYYGIAKIKFKGGIEVNAFNYIRDEIVSISFMYFLLFMVLTGLSIFLYITTKKINIAISHKTGKTTLDTIFDDYDSDEVVKSINEKEKEDNGE